MSNFGGMNIPLTEAQADDLYTLLVDYVGASERGRGDFVHHHSRETFYQFGTTEYRFGGNLGFGGKVRVDSHPLPGRNRIYVDQYREDETPDSRLRVALINAALGERFGVRDV